MSESINRARVDELLDQALLRSSSERAAFVAKACETDPATRELLLRLIAAAESDDGFLDRSALRCPGPKTEIVSTYPAGQYIGAFRLVRRLGVGGMGEVWLAERMQGEFEQQVALKLMLPGASTPLERFKAERRILADLQHPGIARLFDGGLTEEGWPWMAMEYVHGRDLITWCEERKLSLPARLELFLQVCDAVAYAHARLVVHRDLKSANIFVSEEGNVKLLDFGIAKLLSVDVASEMTQTTHLSPAYAAPEQLSGGQITTATDVFALGVTLYQFLSGHLPWPAERAPFGSALRRLMGDTPPLPSRVANGAVPARLLRGDLDAIVAKALRYDGNARYADARALGEDLRRYLNHQPVQARAGARAYVAMRFLRRHWLPLSATAAVFVALVVGLIGVAWQVQRAEREAVRAAATRDFLVGVFRASDPRIAQDKPRGQITARELLDASVGNIDREFAHVPQTRIELLGIAAEIYRELDEGERYEHIHRRHLSLARSHYGELHPIVIAAQLDEAIRAKNQLKSAESLRLLDVLDPAIRKAGLDRSALRAQWWLARGAALFDDSSRVGEQIVALRKAVQLFAEIAPKDPAYVTALADLGTAHSNHMNFAPARGYLEQAIAVAEQVNDRDDAELATIYGNLGLISQNLGDFAGADRAYARAQEIFRRTYGEAHHRYWVPAASRARAAHLGGDREGAQALFEALMQSIPADSMHHDAVEAREWYAGCLLAEGRVTEALPLLEAAEQLYLNTHLYDFQLPRVRSILGDAYDRANRTEDARRMLQAALDQRVVTSPPEFQPVLAIRERWGRFLLQQGDVQGAETQFQEVLHRANGRKLSHVALAHGGLARVALLRNEPQAALASSTKGIELFENVSGFRDVRMGPALWLIHSEVLLNAGDRGGAQQWAQRALDARRRYDHSSSTSIAEAEAALAAAHRKS